MKCICITGATQFELQLVAETLQRAGMQLPKPARHGELISIESWHAQMMAMSHEAEDEGYAITNPGRFMEQLASDIFIANIQSNPWGWADTRSTRLLDFWLNFDPRINFVLVCVSPEQMLANAMTIEAEAIPVDAAMQAWYLYHQELLRFHHRNPQRSLLIDARECAKHPNALIERCIKQWKLPFQEPLAEIPARLEYDALSLFLAQQLCRDYLQNLSLQNELAATVTRLKEEAESPAGKIEPAPEHIITGYRALREQAIELRRTQDNLDEQNQLLVQQQQNVQVKLQEKEQENELLLLQLHQVQEELEAYFLKNESAQKQVGDLKNEIASLTKTRDEQSKLATDRQNQVNTLNSQKTALEKERADLIAKRDALQGEVAKLTKARDEQSKLAGERQATIGQLTKKQDEIVASHTQSLKNAQNKLKETEQENELLLLQLHQVQEELEHYFLLQQESQKQCQELQNRGQAADARWQRMLQHNPDYCDYETIEIIPGKDKQANATTWRFKNLDIAGRSLAELAFKTIIEYGIAGFVFAREPGTTGAFIRWPANSIDENALTLIPVGTRDNAPQRFETLFDLATSDWTLLQKLAALLIKTLTPPITVNIPDEFQPAPLQNGLSKLVQIIGGIPPTLRYDVVSLKNEQVNPDYEHLWLKFENLALNGKHWPEFEVRLSCANVGPDQFGTYPKLEFPEQGGQAPFEAWYIESSDDFGSKLELRFTLPDELDLKVWEALSEHDRSFISALVNRLPAVFANLQASKVQLKRPWDDWMNMAKQVQRLITLRITPPPAPNASTRSESEVKENANPTAQPAESSPAAKTAEKPKTTPPAAKPRQTSKISKARQ